MNLTKLHLYTNKTNYMKISLFFFFVILSSLTLSQKPKKQTDYYYKKLKQCEGLMRNFKKEGTWYYWLPSGRLSYVVNYSNGIPNGNYCRYKSFTSDSSYAIMVSWKNKSYYKSFLQAQETSIGQKKEFEGNYKNGLRDGIWRKYSTLYFSNNDIILEEIPYENNIVNGLCKYYTVSGNDANPFSLLTKTCNYKNGVLHGDYWDETNPNEIISGNYKSGLKDSLWHEYDANFYYQNNYGNGILNGKCIKFKKYDLPLKEETYENGNLNGPFIEYNYDNKNYPNQPTRIQGNYTNGIKSGLLKFFHDTTLLSSHTIENGKRNGEAIEYFPTGKIKRIGNYENDAYKGTWVELDSLGNKKCEQYYQGGVFDHEICKYPNGKISKTTTPIIHNSYKEIYFYENGNKKLVNYFYLDGPIEKIECKYNLLGKKVSCDTSFNIALVEDAILVIPDPIEPAYVVEQSAEFPGGEVEMYKYISQRVKYPEIAKDLGISGTVYTTFTIETDGSVSNINILRSPHSSLSDESIRVLKLMPKWTPGRINGKPVRVKYNVPIKFKLF